jgi:D-3-phosphoglycerate dehydrogenase
LRLVSWDDLLRSADVLSIHVPLHEGTRHLINAETIGRMKPGAIIVNTARGGVIDTAALCDALSSGHLRGAGLDVFEQEPLTSDSPLRNHSRVVLTPHISWYSEESFGELKSRTMENVVNVLQGRPPRDIINTEVLL